jgi:predicted ATPase
VKRFIMTGAPGSGKTSILRALDQMGYAVVGEAATDVIAAEHARGNAEPWRDLGFTAAIARLQAERLTEPVRNGTTVQVHDRSVVCTLALARYLGHPVTTVLGDEVARVTASEVFDRRVLFVRPLGFIENTAARRISYQESLQFERVHEEDYRRLGFEIVDIPAGPVAERAALIDGHISSWLAASPASPPGRPRPPAPA